MSICNSSDCGGRQALLKTWICLRRIQGKWLNMSFKTFMNIHSKMAMCWTEERGSLARHSVKRDAERSVNTEAELGWIIVTGYSICVESSNFIYTFTEHILVCGPNVPRPKFARSCVRPIHNRTKTILPQNTSCLVLSVIVCLSEDFLVEWWNCFKSQEMLKDKVGVYVCILLCVQIYAVNVQLVLSKCLSSDQLIYCLCTLHMCI